MGVNAKLVAVALVVGLLAALPGISDTRTALTPDSHRYLSLAHSILRNGAYTNADGSPHSFSPPLYPALIACTTSAGVRTLQLLGSRHGEALSDAGGMTIRATLVLQVLLFALTAVVLRHFTLLIGFPSSAANGAAFMCGSSPLGAVYCGRILSETVFTLLLLLGMLLLVQAHLKLPNRISRVGAALGAGLLLGMATLTRAILLPWTVTLVAVALLARRGRSVFVISFLGVLMGITPWVARNLVVFERAGVCTTTGTNALHYASGMIAGEDERMEELRRVRGETPLPNPFDETHAQTRAAWNLIRRDPTRFIKRATTTFLAMWVPPIQDIRQSLGLETSSRGTLAVLRDKGIRAAIRTLLAPPPKQPNTEAVSPSDDDTTSAALQR